MSCDRCHVGSSFGGVERAFALWSIPNGSNPSTYHVLKHRLYIHLVTRLDPFCEAADVKFLNSQSHMTTLERFKAEKLCCDMENAEEMSATILCGPTARNCGRDSRPVLHSTARYTADPPQWLHCSGFCTSMSVAVRLRLAMHTWRDLEKAADVPRLSDREAQYERAVSSAVQQSKRNPLHVRQAVPHPRSSHRRRHPQNPWTAAVHQSM